MQARHRNATKFSIHTCAWCISHVIKARTLEWMFFVFVFLSNTFLNELFSRSFVFKVFVLAQIHIYLCTYIFSLYMTMTLYKKVVRVRAFEGCVFVCHHIAAMMKRLIHVCRM